MKRKLSSYFLSWTTLLKYALVFCFCFVLFCFVYLFFYEIDLWAVWFTEEGREDMNVQDIDQDDVWGQSASCHCWSYILVEFLHVYYYLRHVIYRLLCWLYTMKKNSIIHNCFVLVSLNCMHIESFSKVVWENNWTML